MHQVGDQTKVKISKFYILILNQEGRPDSKTTVVYVRAERYVEE